MKRIIKGIMLLGICILVGGCKMNENNINNVVTHVEDYATYKDTKVYTEEEMKEYALERLEKKYNQSFEIDQVLQYGHRDGEDNKPMYLNAHAHVVGDENLECYFVVSEPNLFRDNYATNYYKEAIEKHLKKENADLQTDYEMRIDYHLNDEIFDPNMDYKKYLYSKNCCIDYRAYVPETEDYNTYVPIIKAWMKKLYNAKYDWYFELHDEKDKEKCYFTLYPGDNGFSSAEEWKDEWIYKDILSNVRDNEMD